MPGILEQFTKSAAEAFELASTGSVPKELIDKLAEVRVLANQVESEVQADKKELSETRVAYHEALKHTTFKDPNNAPTDPVAAPRTDFDYFFGDLIK